MFPAGKICCDVDVPRPTARATRHGGGRRAPAADAAAVRAAREVVPHAGQGAPRTHEVDGRRPQSQSHQQRRRRHQRQPSVLLLPVQTGARQPSDGRAQTRVRRPGRRRSVLGRRRSAVAVPSADAAAQDQDGPASRRHDRDRRDHVQVQVRPAAPVAREHPLVRAGPVLATGRFVQVSSI